ncbi:MAG: hypothetical protein JWM50_1065 [Microbacteriaceae bacterium]|jgi:Zn-finger nucleic acid-binding protein|nr:hypothetical protein [Microbacteriaceae bacterium]
MKCPNDSAVLVMSERSGVEIDYCPECRGVWLDRGELDKIIDRAEAELAAPPAAQAPAQPRYEAPAQPRYGDRDDDRRDDRRGYNDGYRGKKKENWLGELFG